MKDVHVEKFLLLPFSLGCDSKSSVATATDSTSVAIQPHKHRRPKHSDEKDEGTKPSGVKKNLGVSRELHKLIKRLLSRLSKLFDFDDEEIEEKEIEIGFPTDVKHVTHIGLDGCTTINDTFTTSRRLSFTEIDTQFPSISAEQFKMAMAAQTCRSLSAKGKELLDDGSLKHSVSSST